MTDLALVGIDAELTLQAQEMVHVGTWVADHDPSNGDDPKHGTVRWSDEMFRLLGLEPQSIPLRYDTFLGFVDERDRPRIGSIIAEAFAARRAYGFDQRMVTRHRGVRVFRSRGSIICDELGRVTRLLGTCVDVTERVASELALAESEEHFRSLFEQSPIGMGITGTDRRIERVNASLAHFLGYDPSELVGRDFLDLTHPDDQERSVTVVKEIKPGASHTYEKRYLHRDGTTVWARTTASLLRSGAGKPIRYMAVVEDIGERHRADEALRKQTEILQGILDHLPVMVVRIGSTGELLYSNREAQRLFGWSEGDQTPADIFAVAFPDEEERNRARAAVHAGGAKWLDFEPRTADGRSMPSSWASVTLSDGTSLMIGQDLTERRQMQQRLSQAQKMEALGQLAGGVAHDFNNILTVMTACASFIKDATESADVAKDAAEIEAACERASALTGQMLAFSRRQMLQPEVVNVNEALKVLTRTMRRLIGENIQLAADLDAAQPNVEVDRHQLEQVVLNLAVNARDAIRDQGVITVSTRNVTSPSGSSELVLSVRDNGSGIEPAIQQRIFEPFFTTKPVGRGTGLGLATVHGIVTQSGGRIELDSTPGIGTEFRVILPTINACRRPNESQFDLPAIGGRETILLVEDENSVRDIARRMLTKLGYVVLGARHGRDALQLAEAHDGPIDLLVTDVVMPELGGRELATRMRQARPRLPVLYISGYTDDELLRKGILDAGFLLVRKPFTKEALARAVRTLLDANTEAPPSPAPSVTARSTAEQSEELALR